MVVEAKYQVKRVELWETYAPMAMVTLLIRVIRIFRPHHELYGLCVKKGVEMHRFSHKNANSLDSIKTTV
jgi:hypothetical protein